jgi:hypothetical protein
MEIRTGVRIAFPCLASPELLQTIQDSVDRIVATAKARSLN